jgi:hypothetical protein
LKQNTLKTGCFLRRLFAAGDRNGDLYESNLPQCQTWRPGSDYWLTMYRLATAPQIETEDRRPAYRNCLNWRSSQRIPSRYLAKVASKFCRNGVGVALSNCSTRSNVLTAEALSPFIQ